MNHEIESSIIPQDIQRLAQLAGIQLAEDLVPQVAAALQEYVDYAEKLRSVELATETQPTPVLDPSRWSGSSTPEAFPPVADR